MIKKILVCFFMIFMIIGCSKNNNLNMPNNIEIYNTENPSNVIKISDGKKIKKLVSIFEKDSNKILTSESYIDPLGLIMATFKYTNYDESFNIYGKSLISDNYYFITTKDQIAYVIQESDYNFITSLLK